MTARGAREAEFHDRVFAERTRSRTWRFYDAARDAYDAYHAAVDAAAAPGRTALEYGCGPGSSALRLAQLGVTVHAIDISPGAIEIAGRRAEAAGLGDRIELHVMDAERLEFGDATFDLVCGTSILHHLDVERGFGELARVVRPGGRVVLLEPLGHNPAINLYRRLTPSLRTADERPLTAGDLERAHEAFATVRLRHFTILALLAAVAHGRPGFAPLLRRLQRIDRALLGAAPPLRRWAWIVVLELSAPRRPGG